jgi:SNF2 family DNA or RNA helicase
VQLKYTPHTYQENAIAFFISRPCAGVFASPGAGKTSITLAAFKILQAQGIVRRMLVVAPLRPCYMVWGNEAQKWDDFRHFKTRILHGKTRSWEDGYDIYTINYEGLRWLAATFDERSWPFDMLVCDESTKLKNTNSVRFKTLRPLLSRFKRRYILTGTPAPNGLIDLFGQVFVMDRGATFGPYITHFRNKYFIPSGFGGYKWVPKPGADKAIQEALAPRVMRIDMCDLIDLPELIENVVYVDLPPKARAVYDEMENNLRVDFKEGRVTAANVAVAIMKCQQIASGGVYLADGECQYIHDAKTEVVADLIDELSGQPALVAYGFKHDLDRLRKALGEVPHIGGGVSGSRSAEIVDAWNRGELPVLLGHPQSMAHGLNLQGAGNTVIWHTLTWNSEDHDQFIARVWRQGQKSSHVFVHYIVARDTVDEAILKALKTKKRKQDALLDALKEYWS